MYFSKEYWIYSGKEFLYLFMYFRTNLEYLFSVDSLVPLIRHDSFGVSTECPVYSMKFLHSGC